MFQKTVLFALICLSTLAIGQSSYVTQESNSDKDFGIVVNQLPANIILSSYDHKGVLRAATNLQNDLLAISGQKNELLFDKPKGSKLIIIGTIGQSPLIDQLLKARKISVDDIRGKWETFKIITVKNPLKGVKEGLVIVGSDKRGTIFGIYDLSRQMGVSPWYWWADVPIEKHDHLYVKAGSHSQGTPEVKYRGIFINDEAPALSGWIQKNYNGVFGHEFYEKVFELILRHKANYLWPAMWGRAFFDDDPLNGPLADEMGVVIGTSHHEPLMRAHVEWERYGKGPWNYETNPEVLQDFWRKSMAERYQYESIVSIGMRGDGDEPMSRETATALLEKIVEDQRKIISETTQKPSSETPQLWALYKEVQDYYDKGMRVPDDVTLLLCDDNWGNIRKLPKLGEKPRKGGYGIYYHFDYVGGPRNYKWLNTNPLPRIWEQMHLAYEYNARQIWIVNVGDIKPMEVPISFFLDYAWNPKLYNQDQLDDYLVSLSTELFGPTNALEIAEILAKYAKYNARMKPELLSPETYSTTAYREADRVKEEWDELMSKAEILKSRTPEKYQDAFYQLIYHPVQACSNLHNLYHAAAKNAQYYQQQRASSNDYAQAVTYFFDKDQAISNYYNDTLANSKWKHFMDQTHIGYTYWQQPPFNSIPSVKLRTLPKERLPALSFENSLRTYTTGSTDTLLIEVGQNTYFDIFNQGSVAFDYSINTNISGLVITNAKGKIDKEERFWLKPEKEGQGLIQVMMEGKSIEIPVKINPVFVPHQFFEGFVESHQVVSIFAEHPTKIVNDKTSYWQILPDIGREKGGITSFPVTAESSQISPDSPHLTYNLWLRTAGQKRIRIQMAPTLAFNASKGLTLGVSIDDEKVELINIHTDQSNRAWEKTVAENLREVVLQKNLSEGAHTLKVWRVDPGIVLRKIVIEGGRPVRSHLGPPESPRTSNAK